MLGPERYPFQDAQQKIYITRQNIPKILPSLEAHSRPKRVCSPPPSPKSSLDYSSYSLTIPLHSW